MLKINGFATLYNAEYVALSGHCAIWHFTNVLMEHTFHIADNGRWTVHCSIVMCSSRGALVYKRHKTDFNRCLK